MGGWFVVSTVVQFPPFPIVEQEYSTQRCCLGNMGSCPHQQMTHAKNMNLSNGLPVSTGLRLLVMIEQMLWKSHLHPSSDSDAFSHPPSGAHPLSWLRDVMHQCIVLTVALFVNPPALKRARILAWMELELLLLRDQYMYTSTEVREEGVWFSPHQHWCSQMTSYLNTTYQYWNPRNVVVFLHFSSCTI